MRIVVLAGGIGGARFLRGLLRTRPEADITVVGNTGDDITLFGLRVCPDLDTVMYTLGGGIAEEQGWGRADERFTVAEELAAYGVGPAWFSLGDRDFATHIVRTQMLDAGYPLSQVTAALCDRWRPGVRLLPMSDDRVETHIVVESAGSAGAAGSAGSAGPTGSAGRRRAVHFQEWWVGMRAEPAALDVVAVGAAEAAPAPGVLEALRGAAVVLLAPSNPVVSIGTILAVPGIRAALVQTRAPVVGVSPIVGGAPVRGMADRVLPAIGVATDAGAVALHYGARPNGLLDGWLVHSGDAGAVPSVRAAGIACRAVPLLMPDVEAAANLARAAVDLAATLRRRYADG